MRLLTGENGPGFCKLSKSRIDCDGRRRQSDGGDGGGLAWCRPAGCGSGRACLGRGSIPYDLGRKIAGNRAKVFASSLLSSSLSPLFSWMSCGYLLGLDDLGRRGGKPTAAGCAVSLGVVLGCSVGASSSLLGRRGACCAWVPAGRRAVPLVLSLLGVGRC